MSKHITSVLAILICCTSCMGPSVSHAEVAKAPAPKASAGSSTANMEQGEAFFQAQKWMDAARIFESIVKAEPKNGKAWARLGAAYHGANEFKKAVAAWEKAVDINKAPGAMYNLACAHARAGHADDAILWLGRSIDAGFVGAGGARKDPDFAGVSADARFLPLVEKAERIAAPCRFDEAFKQFDFWLGEWDVFTPAGQKAGENIVTSASNGCLVLESWTGSRGDTGKSMNFFDPERKQWRQIWVGSVGGITEFVGEFKDGAMRFVGEPRAGQNGPRRRLTFFLIGPQEVRQFAEISNDGGKTFSTQYDFTYKRRGAP